MHHINNKYYWILPSQLPLELTMLLSTAVSVFTVRLLPVSPWELLRSKFDLGGDVFVVLLGGVIDFADGERTTFEGLVVSIFLATVPLVLLKSLQFLATVVNLELTFAVGDFNTVVLGDVFSAALVLLGDNIVFTVGPIKYRRYKH